MLLFIKSLWNWRIRPFCRRTNRRVFTNPHYEYEIQLNTWSVNLDDFRASALLGIELGRKSLLISLRNNLLARR